MHCIFCKCPSTASTSVEHIIPRSLGNEDHILPQGWVCDGCNNYLSREVEGPFMNSEYCRRARFEMQIPSRRRRIPIIAGFHPQSRTKIEIMQDSDGLSCFASADEDEARFIDTLKAQAQGTLWIPASGEPQLTYATARFIGKIGLEILAFRIKHLEGSNEELVTKPELDELRNYVRRGRPGFTWPIHMRRIYSPDRLFVDDAGSSHEVLHEFDILFIPSPASHGSGEFYAVIAILGVEYAINLGGSKLDGLLGWLRTNGDRSYLYCKAKPIESGQEDG